MVNNEFRNKVQKNVAEIIVSLFNEQDYPPIVVLLPSEGIVYPSNSFLFQKQMVVLKKFTGKSEEWSTDSIFMDDKYMLNFLLESLLLFNEGEKKVSIEDWLVADRDVVILQQRIASYGINFGIKMTCKNCGVEIEKDSVKVESQEIEKLNLNNLKQIEPNKNLFWYCSNDFKWNIYFKFLTIKDERELIDNAPEDYKEYGMFSPTSYMEKIVIKINDVEDKNEIKKILYFEMSNPERDLFLEYVEKRTPYVKVITENFKCINCGCENHLRADLDFNILHGQEIKKIMLDEFYLLHKRLRIPFNDLYNLPINIRKELVTREIEQIKKEEKK